jgi:hypothetical protein
MKIGDEVFVHGYVDEIREGHVIIRNDGGYFGTVRSEIRPNDEDVGKPCWKIYVIAERRRFPKTYYDYFCDAPHVVEYWKKFILNGGDATLYARERPFTKSDRAKLGKTVFWTKKEAEDAIGVVYTADTPQTDCLIVDARFKAHCLNCAESGSYKCTKCDGEMYYKDAPQTDCGWGEPTTVGDE